MGTRLLITQQSSCRCDTLMIQSVIEYGLIEIAVDGGVYALRDHL